MAKICQKYLNFSIKKRDILKDSMLDHQVYLKKPQSKIKILKYCQAMIKKINRNSLSNWKPLALYLSTVPLSSPC